MILFRGCTLVLDRRPSDHRRHRAVLCGHEWPPRPIHQIFPARARARRYAFALFVHRVSSDTLPLYCEGLNRMLDSFPTRAAWALCTFAYSAGPGTEPILFEGRTDGRIVPARGPPKFGWDPVFEAEDTGLTYVHSLCACGVW